MRLKKFSRPFSMAAAVVTATALFISPQASADPTAFVQHGPDPTSQSVQAQRGPYATSRTTVSSGTGFNRGTIYYPTTTSEGTFSAVAVIPGFTESESTMSWYGTTLSSHGFVVFTLEAEGGLDFPDARADQLLAALDYLVNSSSVRDRVDRNRLGVMGHSMGGGGTLEAANERPSLRAAIPLAAWHNTKNFPQVQAATLVIGAEGDSVASPGSHSEPFYQGLRSAEKAYLELNNGNHFTTNSYTPTVTKYAVSWLKRFLDDDTRYSQFLCPPPSPDSNINEYRHTCPV
ncbi:alpha/beta hydrolase family protein [Saccharothrix deserti]|uniref:alpha/beta hydrolase family protein n=1 Tax=Saccharothrix deserti TaxID=2593674 RepID=UPI001EE44430|nr:alpha/beta hydrolase [Saccharothrix deserti]